MRLIREVAPESLKTVLATAGAVCLALIVGYFLVQNTDHLKPLQGGVGQCRRSDNAFVLTLIVLVFLFAGTTVLAIGEFICYVDWCRYKKNKGGASFHMSCSPWPAALVSATAFITASMVIGWVLRC